MLNQLLKYNLKNGINKSISDFKWNSTFLINSLEKQEKGEKWWWQVVQIRNKGISYI